jgi:CRISPR-associated protein Cas2
MAEAKLHWLVSYDIRDPARWRKVYKLLRGYGERVQYSMFRCHLTNRSLEKLRWELERRLAAEDALLIVGLCDGCVERVVARNRPESWNAVQEPLPFKIV